MAVINTYRPQTHLQQGERLSLKGPIYRSRDCLSPCVPSDTTTTIWQGAGPSRMAPSSFYASYASPRSQSLDELDLQFLKSWLNDIKKVSGSATDIRPLEQAIQFTLLHPRREALLRTADLWYQIQMKNFCEKNPGVIDVKVFPNLEQLTQPLHAFDTVRTDREFSRFLKEMTDWGAAPIYEVEFDEAQLTPDAKVMLASILRGAPTIEGAFQYKIKLISASVEKYPRTIKLRRYPPSIFERGLQFLHPSKKIHLRYGPGEFSPETLRKMQRHREYGIGLSWKNISWWDTGEDIQAPPWFFEEHDRYHAADKLFRTEESHQVLDLMSDMTERLPEQIRRQKRVRDFVKKLDDREALGNLKGRQLIEAIWSSVSVAFLCPTEEDDPFKMIHAFLDEFRILRTHVELLTESMQMSGKKHLLEYVAFIQACRASLKGMGKYLHSSKLDRFLNDIENETLEFLKTVA